MKVLNFRLSSFFFTCSVPSSRFSLGLHLTMTYFRILSAWLSFVLFSLQECIQLQPLCLDVKRFLFNRVDGECSLVYDTSSGADRLSGWENSCWAWVIAKLFFDTMWWLMSTCPLLFVLKRSLMQVNLGPLCRTDHIGLIRPRLPRPCSVLRSPFLW